MHPNPVFHSEDHAKDIAFAQARGFGILTMNADPVPLISHIPFLLNDDGSLGELHLVRSNPIARALKTPQPVRLAVTGPDSYISPDWYAIPDQVPTWNYVAVHLTGTLERLPDSDMRTMLNHQSAEYEGRLIPKTPWKTDKMTPEVLERMMRSIVPCRLHVIEIAATWKLGQNKPDAARVGAAQAVGPANLGVETAQLAEWMLHPPTL